MTTSKSFFVLVMFLMLTSVELFGHDMPKGVETMVKKYFPKEEVQTVSKGKNETTIVVFKSQTRIEFDEKGNWISASRKLRPLSKSFIDTLPIGIQTYIAKKYPNKGIFKITRSAKDYKVEIPEEVLCFDLKGNIIN